MRSRDQSQTRHSSKGFPTEHPTSQVRVLTIKLKLNPVQNILLLCTFLPFFSQTGFPFDSPPLPGPLCCIPYPWDIIYTGQSYPGSFNSTFRYDEVTLVLQAPFNILLSLEASRESFSSLWTWFLPKAPNTFLFLNSLFCYHIWGERLWLLFVAWTLVPLSHMSSEY